MVKNTYLTLWEGILASCLQRTYMNAELARDRTHFNQLTDSLFHLL
ncbi:MAG: hypothetical protein AB4040_06035 [Synechococcus sp.]